MRSHFARIAAVALSAPLAVGALAAPAAADSDAENRSASTEVTGGTTRLTIAPGVAKVLVGAGILPLPKAPATATVLSTDSGPTARFAFPVTGGSVNLTKVSGAIQHSGGLTFYNVANKKSLTVQGFRVVLGDAPRLTGYVPALKTRIPVFTLSLKKAKITSIEDGVRVSNVGATLTADAAAGLNGALGTSVFAGGLAVGTASVTAELDD